MNEESAKTPPSAKPEKPWPMIWVVIAVLVYAVIHTLVTLLAA